MRHHHTQPCFSRSLLTRGSIRRCSSLSRADIVLYHEPPPPAAEKFPAAVAHVKALGRQFGPGREPLAYRPSTPSPSRRIRRRRFAAAGQEAHVSQQNPNAEFAAAAATDSQESPQEGQQQQHHHHHYHHYHHHQRTDEERDEEL